MLSSYVPDNGNRGHRWVFFFSEEISIQFQLFVQHYLLILVVVAVIFTFTSVRCLSCKTWNSSSSTLITILNRFPISFFCHDQFVQTGGNWRFSTTGSNGLAHLVEDLCAGRKNKYYTRLMDSSWHWEIQTYKVTRWLNDGDKIMLGDESHLRNVVQVFQCRSLIFDVRDSWNLPSLIQLRFQIIILWKFLSSSWRTINFPRPLWFFQPIKFPGHVDSRSYSRQHRSLVSVL